MPANYPASLPSFTTLTDGVDDVLASHQNEPNAEIVAIATELGTDVAGTAATLKARLSRSMSDIGNIDFATSTELTIASGAVTPTQNWHTIDTESDAASDNLDTLTATNATDGFILFFRANNDSRTVVVKHNTGNILCATASDITLDDQRDLCILIYDAALTKWLAGTFSITGGSTPTTPYSIGGRLTLATATPVMTSTQSAKTTIYWTPYNGQIVPIYDGTNMIPTDVGGELSQATTDSTKSPAAVTTNSNYDLFIWNDSGTYRCTRGPAWSSGTSRGTGAGTTELEMVKGIYVNKVAITNGPAAQRGTYVGTVRSNGSSQIDYIFAGAAGGGTAGIIGVWNMYNRVDVEMSVHDTTASWTFSSATAGPLNPGGTGSGLNNRISYVVGLSEDSLDLRMYCRSRTAATNGAFLFYGIGVDSTTVLSATGTVITLSNLAIEGAPTCFLAVNAQLGFHFSQMLQDGDGSNTSSMFGADNQNGLVVKGRF